MQTLLAQKIAQNNKNVNAKPAANTNAINTNKSTPKASTEVEIAKITNPFPVSTLPGVFNQIIYIILALIVMAAVVVIIISGFRMLTGGNNPDQLKKAKKGIVWAIIGLVVAFMSFAIVTIIQRIL